LGKNDLPVSGFQGKVNFIWSVADEILRDDFKRSKYPDVILPFTVLRRIDCVLEPTKERVLDRYESLKGRLDNLEGPLRKASGHFYYNVSPFTFARLLEDPKNVGKNIRAYINGFAEEMRDVLYRGDTSNRSQGTPSEAARCEHKDLVLTINPDTKYCYARCLRCLFRGPERRSGKTARLALRVLGARG